MPVWKALVIDRANFSIDCAERSDGRQVAAERPPSPKQTSKQLLKKTIYVNRQHVMTYLGKRKEVDQLSTFQVSTVLRFAQG